MFKVCARQVPEEMKSLQIVNGDSEYPVVAEDFKGIVRLVDSGGADAALKHPEAATFGISRAAPAIIAVPPPPPPVLENA
eukprot:11172627-Lingulodinium_polyedra.AAC.1